MHRLENNTNYIKLVDVENFINSHKEDIEWINRKIETEPDDKKGYWIRRKGTEEVVLDAIESWKKTLTIYRNDEVD